MNKQHILEEIRRTAKENGGVPLGHRKFSSATGIAYADWYGKHWARWSDAMSEAGFGSNTMRPAYTEEFLFESIIALMRRLGRFPAISDILMARRGDAEFPSEKTFRKFGAKGQLAARIAEYCKDKAGYDDVLGWCAIRVKAGATPDDEVDDDMAPTSNVTKDGYVYLALMKVGREKRYKIGKAILVEQRTSQIALKLPEELELVHAINTDDAYGIEGYWHKRFAEQCTNGEWFRLSPADVRAFKRRKFM